MSIKYQLPSMEKNEFKIIRKYWSEENHQFIKELLVEGISIDHVDSTAYFYRGRYKNDEIHIEVMKEKQNE